MILSKILCRYDYILIVFFHSMNVSCPMLVSGEVALETVLSHAPPECWLRTVHASLDMACAV